MNLSEKFWFAADADAAVDYWKSHYPESCAHVLEQAENICRNAFVFREHSEMERTNEIVSFPGKIKWNHMPGDDPEWIYALNRHTCFLILGKAWRLTGDEKYAAKFVELINDWIEQCPLTEETRGNTWRSLEAGIRVENWLKCFILFSDSPLFTKSMKEKVNEALRLHGEYLMEVNLPFHHLSNWGVLQNHGLALLGLYFDNPEWTSEAVRRLDEETYMQVFCDGTQWEQSPMYHCEVLYALMDSLLHLKRFGVPVPKRLERAVRKMAYSLAYWCKPNGHIPCQGDSDDIDARDHLTMAALLFKDGALKCLSQGIFDENNLWAFGTDGLKEYEALPAKLPAETSKALTDSGNYILRSGWNVSSDYLRLHCGTMGSGHGHGDQLHVDYYSAGEDILIDPGRYTYVDNSIRRELKLPSAHNTVCVDGEEFCECVNSWGYSRMAFPIKGEYCFNGTVNFAMAGHLGYLEKSIFATRKVVALGEGLILITDVFYGNGSHDYDCRFHFGHMGKAFLLNDGTSGPVHVHFEGQHAKAEVFALKGTGALSRTNCSPEYNLLKSCDCLLVHHTKEGTCSLYTVISTTTSIQDVMAERIPVSKVISEEILADSQAEAIRIIKDQKEYVVIFCHQELISEVDYFEAGGYASYGKTIVFSSDNKEGVCVQY